MVIVLHVELLVYSLTAVDTNDIQLHISLHYIPYIAIHYRDTYNYIFNFYYLLFIIT